MSRFPQVILQEFEIQARTAADAVAIAGVRFNLPEDKQSTHELHTRHLKDVRAL